MNREEFKEILEKVSRITGNPTELDQFGGRVWVVDGKEYKSDALFHAYEIAEIERKKNGKEKGFHGRRGNND